MRRFFITLTTLFVIITSVAAQAHLRADLNKIDLGQVEWGVPAQIDYTIYNDGDTPLILADVLSSCGCSVPKWSSVPIGPGESAVITVEFDAKALGKFHKEISIYSNSDANLVYLSFFGEVVRKVTDFSNSHPIKIGNIRVDRDTLDFGTITDGDSKTLHINFVNESSSVYRPVLMHTPHFVKVGLSDSIIARGEGGRFDITINSNDYQTFGYVDTEVYLSRFVGDKVGEENKIPISFLLLPKLQSVSYAAPEMVLDKSKFDLSEKLKRKHRAKGTLLIGNKSRVNTLKVIKIQTFSPAVKVRLKRANITSDKESKLKITVDKSKMLTPNDNLNVLIITNDPNNSAVELKL